MKSAAHKEGTLWGHPSLLDATAYHEAGHAVVAAALGLAVDCVIIGPENLSGVADAADGLGAVRLRDPGLAADESVSEELPARKLMCVCLAGVVAERRRCVERGAPFAHGRDDDLLQVVTHLAQNGLEGAARWTRVQCLERWAGHVVRENWQAVEEVAGLLVSWGAADGAEVSAIVERHGNAPPGKWPQSVREPRDARTP